MKHNYASYATSFRHFFLKHLLIPMQASKFIYKRIYELLYFYERYSYYYE